MPPITYFFDNSWKNDPYNKEWNSTDFKCNNFKFCKVGDSVFPSHLPVDYMEQLDNDLNTEFFTKYIYSIRSIITAYDSKSGWKIYDEIYEGATIPGIDSMIEKITNNPEEVQSFIFDWDRCLTVFEGMGRGGYVPQPKGGEQYNIDGNLMGLKQALIRAIYYNKNGFINKDTNDRLEYFLAVLFFGGLERFNKLKEFFSIVKEKEIPIYIVTANPLGAKESSPSLMGMYVGGPTREIYFNLLNQLGYELKPENLLFSSNRCGLGRQAGLIPKGQFIEKFLQCGQELNKEECLPYSVSSKEQVKQMDEERKQMMHAPPSANASTSGIISPKLDGGSKPRKSRRKPRKSRRKPRKSRRKPRKSRRKPRKSRRKPFYKR